MFTMSVWLGRLFPLLRTGSLGLKTYFSVSVSWELSVFHVVELLISCMHLQVNEIQPSIAGALAQDVSHYTTEAPLHRTSNVYGCNGPEGRENCL